MPPLSQIALTDLIADTVRQSVIKETNHIKRKFYIEWMIAVIVDKMILDDAMRHQLPREDPRAFDQ